MAVNVTYREANPVVPTVTTIKNSPLSNQEIDGNFKSIKDAIDPLGTSAGAGLVGIVPAGGIAAITVQGAIDELDTEKASLTSLAESSGSSLVGYDGGTVQDMLDAVTGPNGAASVGYTPAGTGAVATTVWGKLRESVSVKDFGAVGDGVSNDTAAVQACLTYCSTNSKTAFFPAGIYSVSFLTITNGILGLICEGTIKGQGTAPIATIVLGSAGNPVRRATFVLRMDQSAGDLRAVQGYDTQDCTFTDCKIYGFVNSATLNHYAFFMEGPCTGNVFYGNHLTLYNTPTQRGFGIAFYGTKGTAQDYGGFFSGTITRGQFPAVGNTITGNVIQHGSYAISLQFSEYNTVTGNYCYNQNHRSIYLANAAWGNTISSNVCKEYVSSAVVLGYCSSNNVFSGNICETSVAGGEAAVNINTGAQGNLIEANKINSASNYGVYVATDAIDTTVIGNDIGGHYKAAIAVENDWEDPLPTNALFSRPNYSAPPSPYTAWSYKNMTGVAIRNNVIRAGYAGRSTAGIYIAQITAAGNTSVSNITVAGNTVISPDNIAYNFYMYEETAGRLTDLRLTNNDFHAGNNDASANTSTLTATWNDKVSYFSGNKQIDSFLVGEAINFADGDTSPSVVQNSGVANSRYFVCNNTTATSITTFDDGFTGQAITVRLNANTTIVYGSGTIRTKGLTNIVGSSTNQFVGFIRLSGGIWTETWRNF